MRITVSVISFLTLISFACLAAGAGVSPFDGVWKREWSNITPRGVHQVGSDTVTLRTTGISSDMSTLSLSQTISGAPKRFGWFSRAKQRKLT